MNSMLAGHRRSVGVPTADRDFATRQLPTLSTSSLMERCLSAESQLPPARFGANMQSS